MDEKRVVDSSIEERFDKNDEGKINRGEARTMRHDTLDRNDDGKVGWRERRAARKHSK